MVSPQIDRDKLRAAIRKLSDESIFYMLDEAIDLLPSAKLQKLVKRYLDLEKLQPDDKAKGTLLADIKAFEKASLAGEYYEEFAVNYRNCMQKSKGTQAWISECHRLLDRCVAQAGKGDPGEVCQAFGVVFGLLDHIDECLDDVVFFADEAGSWQIGVDWKKVLPAWFKALSATAEPHEFVRQIAELLRRHCNYRSENMLALAGRIATPEQRKAIRLLCDPAGAI
jgi:hypothetical protein